MATENFDSDTARKEQLLEAGSEGQPVAPYRALWAVLLLGWRGLSAAVARRAEQRVR